MPAPTEHATTGAQSHVDLPPSLQTAAPLDRFRLNVGNRFMSWFQLLADRGDLELDAPYQRGDVWNDGQRRLLIKSFLQSIPVPTIIVNDREAAEFLDPSGMPDDRYAVVDGKQRIRTALAWFDDELDIPASWLPHDFVERSTMTGDGPYVRLGDLTKAGQRLVETRIAVPVATSQLPTLQAEADLYLLINRGGVAHQTADLAAAEDLAG